jgi:hypothetical protein
MPDEGRTNQRDEMYCHSCGALIEKGVQFCPQCDARVATAPESVPPSTAPGPSQPAHAFSSCLTLAWFVIGALLLVIVMDIVGVVSSLAEVRLLTRMIDGELVTIDEAEANDDRQAVVGALQFVVLIVAAILFLIWIYRAHKNLGALGASGLKYSPNWAVGGWFIPIMNLWRPYQVTVEISKASDPDHYEPEGQAWQTAPTPPLVKFWWALWIIGGFIGGILLRLAFQEPEDLEAFRTRTMTFIAADAVDILAAILAILVVWYITSRQEEKNRRLQAATLGLS